MKKTKDYDMFVFRVDNRDHISELHVQKIVESIKVKNMLEMRPVIVNKKMEVIDGQHRILAAKQLDLPIYYEIDNDADGEEVIAYNISKAWTTKDYLNYYAKHNYPEYIKLAKFCKEQNLNLQSAMAIACKKSSKSLNDFRTGKFVFNEEFIEESFDLCNQTIDRIKRLLGMSMFTKSSRFWKALVRVTNHEDFNEDKWFKNVDKFIERFTPKATIKDYIKLFVDIHNHGNQNKIIIDDSDYFTREFEREESKKESIDPRQLKLKLEGV